RNTFIIFLVSGFWHGANWTFIMWGFFHAVLFMPALLLGKNRKYVNTPIAEGKKLPSFNEFSYILLTFVLVTIGWIFFRAPTIADAFQYIYYFISNIKFQLPSLFEIKHFSVKMIAIVVLIYIEWKGRSKSYPLDDGLFKNQFYNKILYYFLILFMVYITGKETVFIYFQF
ncbi:MAG: MBOAT family protein, partial [Pleomorphochaeta sp.]